MIVDVAKAMEDHPEFGPITMRYEDGGRVEVYQMGSRIVRLPPMSTPDQVRAAFDKDSA